MQPLRRRERASQTKWRQRIRRRAWNHRKIWLRFECLEDRALLATFHWVAQDGNFGDAANWQDENGFSGVPGASDAAIIDSGGLTVTAVGVTVKSLTTSSNLVFAVTSGTFSVAETSSIGNLRLDGGATLRAIEGTMTVGDGTSAGLFKVDFTASLNFVGNFTLNAGTSFPGQGGAIRVEPAVPGRTLTVNTSVTMWNLKVGSFGAISVTSGQLSLDGDGASFINGSFDIAPTATLHFNSGICNVNAGASFTGQGSILMHNFNVGNNQPPEIVINASTRMPNLTVTNTVAISLANGTLSIDGPGSSAGLISGVGSLKKVGSGTFLLSGDNAYTGATQIDAGTLQVDSSLNVASIVTVNAGGTLSGTGTVGPIVGNGGTIAPGASAGVLHSKNVSLNSATTLSVELNGTTVGALDQLDAIGSVSLGSGILNVILGFVPAIGNSFTIINNDGIDAIGGTFSGLVNGATFTVGENRFKIGYFGLTGTGNDVVLTVVAPLALSIDDVNLTEGITGSVDAEFTVTLSGQSASPVTVNYATANDTASTADNDYAPIASTLLTFEPGQTSKTVSVPLNGDVKFEAAETFFVNLSAPSGAVLADGQGVGTINNDDLAPSVTLSVLPAIIAGPAVTATVTATLSAVSGLATTIDLGFGGSATNVTDYTRSSTQIVIPVGDTSGVITLSAVPDLDAEEDETITVDISAVNHGTESGAQQVIVTILDEPKDFGDAPAPFPTLAADNGARHLSVGATLGATRDTDVNGQPQITAAGDDLAASDDEDGLVSQSLIVAGTPGSVTVNVQGVTGTYFLSAWVDFNGDGDWLDLDEQIATDATVTASGNQVLSFLAPLSVVTGAAVARFRLTTVAGLSFIGGVSDGEVEDHVVNVVGAGNITVDEAVDNPAKPLDKRLVLTGDVDFNQVRIELGVDGKSTVTITGLNGTKLEGGNVPLDFVGITKGITVNLLGGRDTVIVTGQNVAGPITLDGGEDDDVYILPAAKTKFVLLDSDGEDTLDFSLQDKAAKVDLAKSTGRSQSLGNGNSARITGQFENVIGSLYNDRFKGNAADNQFVGLAGNDTLDGREGADTLTGGEGKDNLKGGLGDDSLDGGTEDDKLDGGDGNDRLLGGAGKDSLLGGLGDDTLDGGSEDDKLDGGKGNDLLRGGTGNDSLKGNDGNDVLLGGEGLDTLSAKVGFDILIGGLDADKLTGGTKRNSLLIGGTTAHDNSDAALLALLAEWSRLVVGVAAPLAERIANLTVGGGANGANVLTSPGTVVDDGVIDALRTSFGSNWIFKPATDTHTGLKPTDVVQP